MEPVIPEAGSRDAAQPRIAYVLGTTAGGTGPHVVMLAQGCAARGMTVRVFGPAETGRRYCPGQQNPASGRTGGGPAQPPGFTAVAIGDRPRPGRDLAAMLRLRRLLRDWSPDVVHAHGLRAGAFAALAGCPGALVVTVHNAPPADRKSVV